MKYIIIDNFQNSCKKIPICDPMRDFMVTKCVGTCNRVLFI